MPSRNVVKEYEADAMYHVYNRGVDKRIIFTDERDYAVFLSFLKYALSPHRNELEVDVSEAQRFNIRREKLDERINLVSYCLMPNHFHLLIYQYDEEAITKLMRSVATGYVSYFNKRHKRVGSLFQGVYKASKINTDAYWHHISRYIHLNPLDLGENYVTYPYSSYRNFVGWANVDWLKPDLIMDGFDSVEEYENFVKDYIPHRNELLEIKDLLANSKEIEDKTVQG